MAGWVREGKKFILEEDNDSGHGTSQKRRADGSWACSVRRFKEENGIKHYFNAPSSPDLAPIENVWRIEKQRLKSNDYWNPEYMRERIQEEWKGIPQAKINKYIHSIPARLKSVDQRQGRMTEN